MAIKIDDFSGALKNRIFKSDINSVFATKYENIDHSRLALIPTREPEPSNIPIDSCVDDITTDPDSPIPTVCSNITANVVDTTGHDLPLTSDTTTIDVEVTSSEVTSSDDNSCFNGCDIDSNASFDITKTWEDVPKIYSGVSVVSRAIRSVQGYESTVSITINNLSGYGPYVYQTYDCQSTIKSIAVPTQLTIPNYYLKNGYTRFEIAITRQVNEVSICGVYDETTNYEFIKDEYRGKNIFTRPAECTCEDGSDMDSDCDCPNDNVVCEDGVSYDKDENTTFGVQIDDNLVTTIKRYYVEVDCSVIANLPDTGTSTYDVQFQDSFDTIPNLTPIDWTMSVSQDDNGNNVYTVNFDGNSVSSNSISSGAWVTEEMSDSYRFLDSNGYPVAAGSVFTVSSLSTIAVADAGGLVAQYSAKEYNGKYYGSYIMPLNYLFGSDNAATSWTNVESKNFDIYSQYGNDGDGTTTTTTTTTETHNVNYIKPSTHSYISRVAAKYITSEFSSLVFLNTNKEADILSLYGYSDTCKQVLEPFQFNSYALDNTVTTLFGLDTNDNVLRPINIVSSNGNTQLVSTPSSIDVDNDIDVTSSGKFIKTIYNIGLNGATYTTNDNIIPTINMPTLVGVEGNDWNSDNTAEFQAYLPTDVDINAQDVPVFIGQLVLNNGNYLEHNFDFSKLYLVKPGTIIEYRGSAMDSQNYKLIAIQAGSNLDYNLANPIFKTLPPGDTNRLMTQILGNDRDDNYNIINNEPRVFNVSDDYLQLHPDMQYYDIEYVDEEYTEVSSITYSLGWKQRTVYSPLFRDSRYNIVFRLYNPTTDSYTKPSLYIPLAGQYVSNTKHNFNLDIYPKFNQELYDQGYTKIEFFVSFNNAYDENTSITTNFTPYTVLLKDVTTMVDGQIVSELTSKLDYTEQSVTFGQIELGNDTIELPEPQSPCNNPIYLPSYWLDGNCFASTGFTMDNEIFHITVITTNYSPELGTVMTLPTQQISFNRNSDRSSTWQFYTEALSNYEYYEIYMFKDNDWRLLWQGNGNMPPRETLANPDKLLPLPCDISYTEEREVTKHRQVPKPHPVTACSLLVSPSDAYKWYYSENLRKMVPLRQNEYAIDYNRFTLLFGENNLMRRFDKPYWVTLGIKPPKVELTNSPNGNQEFKFLVTFYNSDIDIESGPSNKIVTQSSFGSFVFNITLSEPENYNTIRVYCLTDNLLGYTLVKEFAVHQNEVNNITVTIDNIDDLVGNRVLLKANNDLALPNLKYPITTAGVVIAALDNKVYFSEQGDPTSWPAVNYIEFTQEVTGLGKTNQGIIVFTKEETYIIVGTSIKTFTKYLLSAEVGCVNGDTVCSFNNGVAFASYHGIYWTSGGNVTSLTNKLLGKLYLSDVTRYAAVANKRYALLLDTDDIFELEYYKVENKPVILEIDSKYNMCIKTSDEQAKFIGPVNDELFVTRTEDSLIYKLYPKATPKKTMHYYSGLIVPAGYSINKVYKDVFISYQAPIHIKIIGYDNSTDTRVLLDIDLPANRTQYNAKLLNGHNLYGFEIEVIGKGEVYEISFNTKERT